MNTEAPLLFVNEPLIRIWYNQRPKNMFDISIEKSSLVYQTTYNFFIAILSFLSHKTWKIKTF